MALIYDTEGDGFLEDLTQLHCICIWDTINNTKEIYAEGSLTKLSWYGSDWSKEWHHCGTIEKGIKRLSESDDIKIAHYQLSYDLQAIKKLYPVHDMLTGHNLWDTGIISRLLFPENSKSSIEFWAEELGLSTLKIPNEDWSTLTLNMLERCCSDVEINKAVADHFQQRMKGHGGSKAWADAIRLEQEIAKLHAKQVHHGVRFDVFRAAHLVTKFSESILLLEDSIISESLPVQVIPWKRERNDRTGQMESIAPTVEAPFLKNGNLKKAVVDYFEGSDAQVKGPYSKVSWRQINLDSQVEVKDWLLKEGWKPTKYTPTGAPSITVELRGLEGSKLGKKYKDLNILKHRKRFLLNDKGKGAISLVRRRDGRVPAQAITLGTPTARYRHSGAVCNIPRPTSPYGTEIRSLFCVPTGFTQVGIDLSGIESRMMAHYCYRYKGGKALAALVLTGDFHQHNADLLGCDRDTAKTFLYALMYGAGVGKMASILGCSNSRAKVLIADFWNGNPALKSLIADLEKSYKMNGGFIRGLDGRHIYVRSERVLLNCLLQSAAAIVFKHWMVLIDRNVCLSLFVNQLLAYHDEVQLEVDDRYKLTAEEVGKAVCELATEAGHFFDLEVEITAEAKVGKNWSDCH